MADWNRTDYDALEAAARWRTVVLSNSTLVGVSPALVVHLALCLAALAMLT